MRCHYCTPEAAGCQPTLFCRAARAVLITGVCSSRRPRCGFDRHKDARISWPEMAWYQIAVPELVVAGAFFFSATTGWAFPVAARHP